MYTTEGIILKRSDAGEADSFFTIYTKDFGKIRALAQGIKKEGAKLKGHLETLNHSAVSFVLGKSGERLTSAMAFNYWPKIHGDFDKLRAAFTLTDLIDVKCFLGEKDERLWQLILDGFSSLDAGDFKKKDFSNFLQEFNKKFAAALGYAGISDAEFLSYN